MGAQLLALQSQIAYNASHRCTLLDNLDASASEKKPLFVIMKAELTAIIKQNGDWWLGWVEEIPGANAQEKTKEELMISLREAAKDILELYRQAARQVALNLKKCL